MDKYFLLLLSAFLFASQVIFTKLFERSNGSTYAATARFSLVSEAVALVVLLCSNGFRVEFTVFSVIMAGALAVVCVLANVIGIKTMSLGSVAVYTLFLMLGGMIVPFIAGAAFLDEQVKIPYIIATVLLGGALVLPVFDKGERQAQSKKTFLLFLAFCFVVFLLNGANSTIGKFHQVDESKAVGTTDFLILKGFFGVGISGILLLFCKEENKYKRLVSKSTLIGSAGFAVVNVAATLLQLYCAITVDSCLMYPLVTGGVLVFTPVLSRCIFKEKITALVAAEILVSVVATVLFVF